MRGIRTPSGRGKAEADGRGACRLSQGDRYGFTPLRGNRDWAKNVYQVVGTPTNFLLDRQGRVIVKPHPYDAETERTLELEIEALIDAGR